MISEEEANAQLERLQQRLTLNLQEIDRNFTECNQILTSKIITEVEKYSESTHRIWNHSKIWLYFFNSLNEISDQASEIDEGTNRPAHDLTLDSLEKWQQKINHDVSMKDITTISKTRMVLQAPSITSQESTSQRFHEYSPASVKTNQKSNTQNNNELLQTISTDSTSPASYQDRYQSPPHSIPFAPSPKSLIGTPIREQARILTENVLQTVGIHSSDEEEDEEEGGEEGEEGGRSKRRKQDAGWDKMNILERDDLESRANFHNFMKSRQEKYQNKGQYEELPTMKPIHSPSSRYDRHQSSLTNTPTMDRVMEKKQSHLKESHQSPTFMDMTPLNERQELENEQTGAYEFTEELGRNGMGHRDRTESTVSSYNKSVIGDELTNITMMSGATGQIPAKFALHYFPEKFRTPPASTQLSRIYHFFADRPGTLISLSDIIKEINDKEYAKENVQLLINLLVRRKFLKRVGDKDAWTVRR